MSTDFTTGKNIKISKDDLYLMKCDIMSQVLGISRETLYQFFVSKNECSGSGQWGYYDRYSKDFNSNDYTGNKLDDLFVLSAAMNKDEYLDKSDETINSRKNSLQNLCNEFIEKGFCNQFNLTGFIPHLDRPDQITALKYVSGMIPCIEKGYETLTPIITYTDSCGCGSVEPVPQYSLDYSSDKSKLVQKLGNDIANMSEGAEFHWEITSNSDQIKISDTTSSMQEPYIEIAALSTAYLSSVNIDITYSEN